MQKFGDIQLGPNEFIFYLETNAPIDAARLAQFLSRLGRPPKRGKFSFPDVEIDILELRSGSLFGRCGAKYKNDPTSPDGDKQLASEYRRLRNQVENRVAIMTAPAPDNFVAHAVAPGTPSHDQILTVMLLLGFIASITSARPSSNADLAAEMMDLDGISHFEFRTADHRWQVYQSNVPEYQLRRDEGPRPERQRQQRERALTRREDEEDYLTLGGEALMIGGQRLRAPRSIDSAREAFAPTSILRETIDDAKRLPEELLHREEPILEDLALDGPDAARKGRDILLAGVVSVEGEVYRIHPESETALSGPIILVPADDFIYEEGGRYEVRGKAYRFTPGETLFVAKRSREILG